jgi:DNA polymerase-3 subunit gamma/tau
MNFEVKVPVKAAEAMPVAPIVETVPEPSVVEIAAEILGVGAVPVEVLEPEAPTPSEPDDSQPSSNSAAELQRVTTEALSNAKNQASAADALSDAEWTVDGGEVRVQTEISKTMLPMVVNPEAEKIVRAALKEAGAGALKLVLLPGTASSAEKKKPRAPKSGSIQAKALEHPVVQQAQKLFQAEIRTVIDLREN